MMPPFPHSEELDIPDLDEMPTVERMMLQSKCEEYGMSEDNYLRWMILTNLKLQGDELSPALNAWLLAVYVQMYRIERTTMHGVFQNRP